MVFAKEERLESPIRKTFLSVCEGLLLCLIRDGSVTVALDTTIRDDEVFHLAVKIDTRTDQNEEQPDPMIERLRDFLGPEFMVKESGMNIDVDYIGKGINRQ